MPSADERSAAGISARLAELRALVRSQPTRVAISQRICPSWRVPLFAALSRRAGIDLTLYYGRGTRHGAAQNDPRPTGFRAVRLPTLALRYTEAGAEKYRAVHPTLLAHLFAGKHDVVLVEPFTNLPNDLQARFFASVTGAGFIWMDVGRPPHVSRARRALTPLIDGLIRGADACIALNTVAERDFLELDVPKRRVFLAPNAIDTGALRAEAARLREARSDIRSNLGAAGDDFVVLYVGALESRKRVNILLTALTQMWADDRSVRAVVVGDGSRSEDLRAMIAPEHRDLVRFEGAHYHDVARYFVAADVVVLPGQGGLTINQAMACGLPCVTSRDAVAGGDTVTDYVEDRVTGLLITPNSVPDLSCALGKLRDDPGLRRQLGANALLRSDSHSLDHMVDAFEAAILSAATRGRQLGARQSR